MRCSSAWPIPSGVSMNTLGTPGVWRLIVTSGISADERDESALREPRRREDRAVEGPPQPVQHAVLELVALLGVDQQLGVAGRLQLLLRAADDAEVERVGDVRDEDGDGPGPAGRERTGRARWARSAAPSAACWMPFARRGVHACRVASARARPWRSPRPWLRRCPPGSPDALRRRRHEVSWVEATTSWQTMANDCHRDRPVLRVEADPLRWLLDMSQTSAHATVESAGRRRSAAASAQRRAREALTRAHHVRRGARLEPGPQLRHAAPHHRRRVRRARRRHAQRPRARRGQLPGRPRGAAADRARTRTASRTCGSTSTGARTGGAGR